MRRLFVDEAGDFNFKPQPHGGSKLFVLTSVSVPHGSQLGGQLNDLRHRIALGDDHLRSRVLHATTDYQSTRDAVYALIRAHPIEIHATVVDKSTMAPELQTPGGVDCYLNIWDRHLEQIGGTDEPTLITAAKLFTDGKNRGVTGVRGQMLASITKRLVASTSESQPHQLVIVPCEADPYLQVADYCCWAIQRRFERVDLRSYELIADQIASETVWA